ncbi:MAG: class D sortase [Acidobacteria bacterium]|jgi:sortase A|nr:MAG: class D sortase [Acidobacteriota bacterium]
MKSIAISVNKKPVLIWLERILLAVAILCLGTWLYSWIDSAYYQYRENKLLDESLSKAAEAPPAASSPGQPSAADTDSLGSFQPRSATPQEPARKPLAEGELVGRIEIPRLGISTIVLEGVDSKTLRRGVGHIPETAPPGAGGNVGLAAHRDSFFRGLKDIRKNDIIRLKTLDGSYQYRVEQTEIVTPEDTQVLANTGIPELTLVTCYPFYYVGSAPKRFIVHAQRVE